MEQRLSQQRDSDVSSQSGPHHPRGEGVDRDRRALELMSQLECEQQVGQLALTVAESFVVVPFAVQVVKVDVAVFVEFGGNDDNAAGRRSLEEVQQQVSEEEVAQVIHSKLHLKTIFCLRVGTLIDPGVVDQHINLRFLLTTKTYKTF